MQIKFKKLVPTAVEPKQGTPGSAGFDLTAVKKWEDPEHFDLVHYGTGLAVEIPEGYAGFIFPRSSCYKKAMSLTNCVGVIDSDYRGEIRAVFQRSLVIPEYEAGERIMQMIILPIPEVEYVEVDELSETVRGTGGYGSTGK